MSSRGTTKTVSRTTRIWERGGREPSPARWRARGSRRWQRIEMSQPRLDHAPPTILDGIQVAAAGAFASLDAGIAHLHRLARTRWDEAPNRAPCKSWKTCGRSWCSASTLRVRRVVGAREVATLEISNWGPHRFARARRGAIRRPRNRTTNPPAAARDVAASATRTTIRIRGEPLRKRGTPDDAG